MADRVRALKIETPVEGGTQTDAYPTEVNPNQDAIDANGLYIQTTVSKDSLVLVDRDPSDNALRFTDPIIGTKKPRYLVSSLTTDQNSHQALADLIHFIDDGPADGWATGATKVRSGTGALSGGFTWYTDSTLAKKIIDCVIAYPTGSILASTKTWHSYASDGATVLVTLTDTLTWSGPVIASVSRSHT